MGSSGLEERRGERAETFIVFSIPNSPTGLREIRPSNVKEDFCGQASQYQMSMSKHHLAQCFKRY